LPFSLGFAPYFSLRLRATVRPKHTPPAKPLLRNNA
jgi:hypothetical protein